MAGQLAEHGIRNPPDAHLERRTVGNQGSDLARDPQRFWRALAHGYLRERIVDGHDVIDLGDVDERVAERPWHLRVDLGDHEPGSLRRRLGDADLHSEGAEPMLVGRSHVHEGDVQREPAVREQQRDLREKARREISSSIVDRVAHVRADEQRVHPQVAGQRRVDVVGVADREHLGDLHVANVRCVSDQRGQQGLRDGAVTRQEHAVAGRDGAHRPVRRRGLATELVDPAHGPCSFRWSCARRVGRWLRLDDDHRSWEAGAAARS